jgi:hypothetical protein
MRREAYEPSPPHLPLAPHGVAKLRVGTCGAAPGRLWNAFWRSGEPRPAAVTGHADAYVTGAAEVVVSLPLWVLLLHVMCCMSAF